MNDMMHVPAAFGAMNLIPPGSLSVDGRPSEESLANEWVCNNAADWRYDHTINRWFRWDGSRWLQDGTREALQSMREHIRQASFGGPWSKHKAQPSIGKASVARGMEMLCQIDQRCAVQHDVWDQDSFLLGTPAGIIDLRTGGNAGADRSAMITKATSVAPAPGQPARWLQFIREVTRGDDELARFLKLALGYTLTGSTREHALFFGYGGGKNGKSVLLNTVSRIMADYAVTATMDTFTASNNDKHPTELARLDGARLVTASETEEGRAWAEARIKQLTGGDRIAGRFMRQDFFEFTPRFKLFIVGNFRPRLHSVDEATRRRFNIIPFLHVPAKPDQALEAKLAAEHPQILRWMINGAVEWFATGLPRPAAIAGATDDYFADQDLLGQWIAERCEVRDGALGKTGDLYKSWCDFAVENGEAKGAHNTFGEALAKRGFASARRNALGRVYLGIDLRKGSRDDQEHVA